MPTSTKPVLVGPSLKTLTPAQLEELIRLISLDLIDALDENEGEWNESGDEGRSLHPKYKFIWKDRDFEGDPCDEYIEFWEWYESGGEYNESDTAECSIHVGQVIGRWGDNCAVLEVVKWFLDNGWSWAA